MNINGILKALYVTLRFKLDKDADNLWFDEKGIKLKFEEWNFYGLFIMQKILEVSSFGEYVRVFELE